MNIEVFKEEVKKLGITLTQDQLNQLALFYQLLLSWNEKMNLTRITSQEEVYLKHFYDSLTIYKEVKLETVDTLCDIGSGAGFPGIVLKIAFPNLDITLIDSLQKRVNYLNEIIKELKLSNIRAIHTRAEDYARVNRERYQIVTARAVANLKVLSELCLPLVKENGYFIAMKGNIDEELAEARAMIGTLGGKIENIHEFSLPIEESHRTLIKIKKEKKTDKMYPRKKIK
ncbi:MAG TPA: 16S rRNA (guanine(527)-N(7))-methyltransferase RsmG [Candidatus Scybalousia intestinigallinarum]|nr:16S rRNA (guanine(527)-N(7))-methyltransferase RsmG [Candidatus Scybalousia intestinigallinarum]